MFLKLIKDFAVKRVLNNSSYNVTLVTVEKKIQRVGLLIDETSFVNKEEVMQLLVNNGFSNENLSLLVYKDHYKKKEVLLEPHYSLKNISWLGTIENQEVKDFIAKDFDLLISYYNENKPPLQLVTHLSKASFKVGFYSADTRHNHFLIDTQQGNYTLFISELFKYLKILNKI
jgi:hypothetical protein